MARFYNLRLISFVFDVMFILDFIFTYAVNHRHWPNTYGIKRSSLWTRVNKKTAVIIGLATKRIAPA